MLKVTEHSVTRMMALIVEDMYLVITSMISIKVQLVMTGLKECLEERSNSGK